MKLRITDDRYDNTGTVYDFKSKQDLIDEMMPTLKDWAFEHFVYRETEQCDTTEEEILQEMIKELKSAIVVV